MGQKSTASLNHQRNTRHADSSLARWNTDPADYPDYAFAPLKFEGADKKKPSRKGPLRPPRDRSPIAR
jgi:hypothetical protein